MTITKVPPLEIDIPVWWKSGGMLYNRDCLDSNHPEHPYNYIKRTYGVDPELYGIYCDNDKPDTTRCPRCGLVFKPEVYIDDYEVNELEG